MSVTSKHTVTPLTSHHQTSVTSCHIMSAITQDAGDEGDEASLESTRTCTNTRLTARTQWGKIITWSDTPYLYDTPVPNKPQQGKVLDSARGEMLGAVGPLKIHRSILVPFCSILCMEVMG